MIISLDVYRIIYQYIYNIVYNNVYSILTDISVCENMEYTHDDIFVNEVRLNNENNVVMIIIEFKK